MTESATRTELVVRTAQWSDPDAVTLRAAMAAEVGPRYSDRVSDAVRATTNAVDPESVHVTILLYVSDIEAAEPRAVGHAALRWNGDDLEVKRMFVVKEHRGTGVSTALLSAVEDAAREVRRPRLILQTGDRQPDAVRLYEKSGYSRIPIFSPYEALPFSNCFEKVFG
ncbi:GNAT family N-acetyltransferase [Rhodococcus sp. ACS1]|uniref:GNAT family N-acetyltransferase n=1 Tax=Rhodococcus sp. ACS1 TaxID=2028570 RepID=UPI000BB0CE7D|nr:GNAT family N-acetyltransferase [Rhodococcus sp. ACS1]PBC44995.1 GNAT family N-acetyltransferase [Rhodococcus sp. ACS1]